MAQATAEIHKEGSVRVVVMTKVIKWGNVELSPMYFARRCYLHMEADEFGSAVRARTRGSLSVSRPN